MIRLRQVVFMNAVPANTPTIDCLPWPPTLSSLGMMTTLSGQSQSSARPQMFNPNVWRCNSCFWWQNHRCWWPHPNFWRWKSPIVPFQQAPRHSVTLTAWPKAMNCVKYCLHCSSRELGWRFGGRLIKEFDCDLISNHADMEVSRNEGTPQWMV